MSKLTMNPLRMLWFLTMVVLSITNARAEELKIAVASNFKVVMESLVEDFEQANPSVNLILVSGSSGKLYAQIKHGAPFDLFMSADQDKPKKLVEEGWAIPESRFTYAVGSLVLWSADSKRMANGEKLLKALAFNKIALANAKLAPYGFAAEQVLKKLGLEKISRSMWVQGENVAQSYQYVATQNADVGFVAKSQVWKRGRLISGSIWEIPTDMYSPINQDAVILKRTNSLEQLQKVIGFLQTPEVRAKLNAYGYQSQVMEPGYKTGDQF